MLAGVAPAGLKPIATAARLNLATLPRCEQTVAAATNGCLRWFKASDDFAQKYQRLSFGDSAVTLKLEA